VRDGQTVVRLKAGDPFVFGRGGEEVDALRTAGLPVSVVPGITAALGCAASAGIPLTHRRIASAVTFVSGHSAEGSREAAWPALAAQGHTLAIYMGASEAAAVRDRLLGAGADPTTPVAIIENGTRPDERVSVGRLSDLVRLAVSHSQGDAGPSLIIVGDVAALAAGHLLEQGQLPLAKVS
jgi:uroporphyrin-III C-methyltransferase/precorrin-2 dehydrogenase/sirohydrochlorin ferrochelatase